MNQLFLAGFFLLISGGLFFSYIDPTYAVIKDLQVKNARLSDALDKSRELQEVRDSLRARYNTFNPDDIDRLGKLVPDNIDNIRLILDIDGIAQKHNLQVEDFEFSDDGQAGTNRQTAPEGIGVNSGPFGTVTFQFRVSSEYETFRAFMDDLEKSLRIVDITELSLEPGEGDDGFTFNVTIRTYWLR